jgi:Flp pilus assembly secretin CpaC
MQNKNDDAEAPAAGSLRRVTMKRFSMSAVIVALMLAISPARAGIEAARPSVTLEVGAGSTFMLERPFRTVLIGNSDIVDVQTRSDRSVRLEPLNSGTTNLIFVDEQGKVITNLTVVVRSARAI